MNNHRQISGGKVPPQDIELEETVLGAIMLEKEALEDVIDNLHPDVFYKEPNRIIFKAILSLNDQNLPIDLLTISSELRKMGQLEIVGGIYYLTNLTDRVVSAANIEYHTSIIVEKYIQRELIKLSTETIESCYTGADSVFDIIGKSEITRDGLLSQITTKGEMTNRDLAIKTISNLRDNKDKPMGANGVLSGFRDIDKVTGGWQKSDLVIIAARPGMGKTSFVLKCAINSAKKYKKPVAVFSLEMSAEQLMNKQLSIETGIPLEKFKSMAFTDYDMKSLEIKQNEIGEYPIYWDETSAISVLELRAKCRKLKRKHKIEMVVIDYLQLMTTGKKEKNSFREQDISFISGSLKALAKELDIVVIALAQLSRKVEERADKRPMLSDLRESGAIEQDADMVCFLYRPEYYGKMTGPDGFPTAGVAEFIISKNRNGKQDDVEIKFIGKNTDFVDSDLSVAAAQEELQFVSATQDDPDDIPF